MVNQFWILVPRGAGIGFWIEDERPLDHELHELRELYSPVSARIREIRVIRGSEISSCT
jgi:hypothetical protein